eukprot:scpid86839/ scgid33286/ 
MATSPNSPLPVAVIEAGNEVTQETLQPNSPLPVAVIHDGFELEQRDLENYPSMEPQHDGTDSHRGRGASPSLQDPRSDVFVHMSTHDIPREPVLGRYWEGRTGRGPTTPAPATVMETGFDWQQHISQSYLSWQLQQDRYTRETSPTLPDPNSDFGPYLFFHISQTWTPSRDMTRAEMVEALQREQRELQRDFVRNAGQQPEEIHVHACKRHSHRLLQRRLPAGDREPQLVCSECTAILHTFFRSCQYPTANQKRSLLTQVGMERHHLDSWFSNKRRQMRRATASPSSSEQGSPVLRS